MAVDISFLISLYCRIFDFMYLGSEWNASNLEELNSNGVTHVLNVTREIGRTQCVDHQGWEVGSVVSP